MGNIGQYRKDGAGSGGGGAGQRSDAFSHISFHMRQLRFELSRRYQDLAMAIAELQISRRGVEFRTSLPLPLPPVASRRLISGGKLCVTGS